MKTIEAVVAGHLCLDIMPKFDNKLLGKKLFDVISPGKLVNVEKAVVSTGGTVSNTGIALKKFGVNAALISKVGDEPQEIIISNIWAVDIKDIESVNNEFVGADIVATTVGVNVLKKIAPVVASGIHARTENKINSPLNIIICENLLNAGDIFKKYIKNNIPSPRSANTLAGILVLLKLLSAG